MTLSRLLAAVAVLVVAGLVYFLWPKAQLTPEQELRSLVAHAVAAAEQKDVGAFAALLADDFKGPSSTSKQDVKRAVAGYLFRSPANVTVLNPVLTVQVVSATAATFEGTFVFAQPGVDWQQAGAASRYEIAGRAEERAGEWRFVEATWKRP